MAVLVGKPAPDFSERAVVDGNKVVDDFSLSQFKGKKYVLLFFYPFDFTFVCPTEIHSFQDNLDEFEKRNTQVVGCSIDSHHVHTAWLNTPKAEGGIQGVTFPLVADVNKSVARDYDVLLPEGMTLRGAFLIDRQGVVQHQVVNADGQGRNIQEAIRMVDALQFFEEHGEVCPANWTKGQKTLAASREGVRKFFGGK